MLNRVRLVKTDEQEVHNQERHFQTVKEVLNEQMKVIAQLEQISVNFANDFYKLVDGASYNEIASMIGVFIGVWEAIEKESLGENTHGTSRDDTDRIVAIKDKATRHN